jgi:hypothetical protein
VTDDPRLTALKAWHDAKRGKRTHKKTGSAWATNNVGGRPAKLARSAAHRQQREALWEDAVTEHDRRIPKIQRKTIHDLTPFTCRFPVGDPRTKNFFFCGAAAPFYAYCDCHHNIAWRSPRRT